jgi:hypothetical protein
MVNKYGSRAAAWSLLGRLDARAIIKGLTGISEYPRAVSTR